MKSVLISIQPKWCELIASGKKTIEVRKTKPKLETPFKVYIYCTKNTFDIRYSDSAKDWQKNACGKVIGEFVCDVINPIYSQSVEKQALCAIAIGNGDKEYYENSCVSYKEAYRYFKNAKMGYAWHISNLVIYDKPKELNNFCKPTLPTFLRYEDDVIKRPPQSWCYVEGVEG